jgi:uncharacterized HAD superfamily protein
MANIAFVDIDGVIANNDARFEQATINGKVDWSVAFDPALIPLDTLIDGVVEQLQYLQKSFTILLFSSRPEALREATTAWLTEHDVPHTHLVLKPPAAQYVKTAVWKALTLDTLAMVFNVTSAIFVDDEAANINEVSKYIDDRYGLKTYSDLASAAAEAVYQRN